MSERTDIERICALLKNLLQEQEKGDGAAVIWGRINEEAGAELIEAFRKEKRIQSYVLAAQGSSLDRKGVDAVLHLWNQAYMPLNFKSSSAGQKKHGLRYPRIPCLIVSRAEDPEFNASRAELVRLIAGWYGNFAFNDSDLIPCFRLSNDAPEFTSLQSEVNRHFSDIQQIEKTLTVDDGWRRSSPKKTGGIQKTLNLNQGMSVAVEFFRGPKALTWIGKRKRILIVIPEKAMSTAEFRETLTDGLRKYQKVAQ